MYSLSSCKGTTGQLSESELSGQDEKPKYLLCEPRNVLRPIAKKLVPFSLPRKTSVEDKYYFVLFLMTAVYIPHPPQNMILNFRAKLLKSTSVVFITMDHLICH